MNRKAPNSSVFPHFHLCVHQAYLLPGVPPFTSHQSPTTASASISTSISGAISLLTSTMLVAGRISPKNSPCARPTFSHSAMFVTKMRVRTTSFKLAPAFASAASMFLIVCTVCARKSPTPTIFPSGPVAVVPDTVITLPILTAREYPTIGSHGAPLEIFCLGMLVPPFFEIMEKNNLLSFTLDVTKWLVPLCRGTPWEDVKLSSVRRRNRED